MYAACGLLIAIVATYAAIGLVAFTGRGDSLLALPGSAMRAAVVAIDETLGSDGPRERLVVPGRGGVAVAEDGVLSIQLGRLATSTTISDAIRVTNPTDRVQPIQLSVLGAPSIAATLPDGSTSGVLGPHGTTRVTVRSHDDVAGPIDGTLVVSLARGDRVLRLPLAGAQAPAEPSAPVARPKAAGAVDVSWEPSSSKGVAGYAVYRKAPGQAAVRVGRVEGTSFTDTHAADGAGVRYVVRAVAVQVSPELLSAASATPRVTPDATGPAEPLSLHAGTVNAMGANAVELSAALPESSVAADRITLSLGDGSHSVSATAAGGVATAHVTVDATALADGPLTLVAVLEDELGNTTRIESPAAVVKDTHAPAAPAAVAIAAPEGGIVNVSAAGAVQVAVAGGGEGQELVVVLRSGEASVRATAEAGVEAVTLDASQLPDGPLSAAAWFVDRAGNASPATESQGGPVLDTVAPAAGAVAVPEGEGNAAGLITPASQSSVTVAVTYPGALSETTSVVVTVAGEAYRASVAGAVATVSGLDLTTLPDGPVALVATARDAAGNESVSRGEAIKDTTAPASPELVTVAAGLDNTEGHVSRASQERVALLAQFADVQPAGTEVLFRVAGQEHRVAVEGTDALATNVDLRDLTDGRFDFTALIVDRAGNVAEIAATGAKDTLVPAAPARVELIADAGDEPGAFGAGRAACLRFDVHFEERPDADARARVTLLGGKVLASESAPADAKTVRVGCLDASGLPSGPVEVTARAVDAAGNFAEIAGDALVRLAD
jgi:hypothetical protein